MMSIVRPPVFIDGAKDVFGVAEFWLKTPYKMPFQKGWQLVLRRVRRRPDPLERLVKVWSLISAADRHGS